MATSILQPIGIYRFTQATPAATWTIAHGMNTYPVVDVYVTVDGAVHKVLPDSVTYADLNNVTLTFSQAYAGTATVA